MQGLGAVVATLMCLLVFLTGQTSATFWRPTELPSNPNDPYYQAFEVVPPRNVTAKKLMANFLHIPQPSINARRKRQSGLIEDIVIVMDGSGSVGSCEFNKGKKALKNMMGLAHESGGDTKYAAVTFASSASVNFKFFPYALAAKKTMAISYPNGMTNTQAGLVKAKELFVDQTSGVRAFSRKMVFLVTDGQSNVQKQLTIPKAKALKDMGVHIFVVAVGSYINGIDEMVKVASYPPENYLFRVKNLQGFWKIIKLIIQKVAPDKYKIIQGQYDPPC